MIVYVTPALRHRYKNELQQFYALRNRVFCQKLGWVEPRADGLEIDRFDSLYHVAILYLDPDCGKVAGGVRLMPTTGPTLMHSVWADLLPAPDAYRSPDIWEATRFCVDETISTRKSNLLNRATLALSIAVADFGNANGISHVIGVCERYFFDMSGMFGPKPEIVSSKFDENGLEISCGIWSTANIQTMLQWSRSITGNVEPAIIREVA